MRVSFWKEYLLLLYNTAELTDFFKLVFLYKVDKL